MSSVQGKEVNALLADHLITNEDIKKLKLSIEELNRKVEDVKRNGYRLREDLSLTNNILKDDIVTAIFGRIYVAIFAVIIIGWLS